MINLEEKLKNQNSRINDLEEEKMMLKDEKKMIKDEADTKYLSKCMLYFDRYHLKTNNIFKNEYTIIN